MAAVSKIVAVILFIDFIIVCVYLYMMHMYSFLCSDSLLYTLFLSTLHGVYTRDCSCMHWHILSTILSRILNFYDDDLLF